MSSHKIWISLVLSLLLATPAVADDSASPAKVSDAANREASEITDPLLLLNMASRGIYADARQKLLARSGPIILLQGDTLTLQHGDKVATGSFASSDYDSLKSYCHIALALDVALIAAPDRELSPALLSQLTQYRPLVVAAGKNINQLGLTSVQEARQDRIVDESLKFIDLLIEQKTCSVEQRREFIRGLMPLIMANMNDAAIAQLDAIDGLIRQWRDKMPPEDWQKVRVIILGKQLPRKDNLAVQYFARLLNVPGEGNRLVYAESITELPKAIDLLGTNLLDTEIGIDFFDDPVRMKRDLLGDAARAYLPKLFAEHQQVRP